MISLAAPARATEDEPGEGDLAEAQTLYDRGLLVQAHRRLAGHPSPLRWQSSRGLVLAARLWANLGGSRSGEALIVRAWRRARDDRARFEAAYYYAHHLLASRGPLACWEFLERLPSAEASSVRAQANLWIARAEVLTAVRDFDAADAALSRAERLDGDHLWCQVERSSWHERQDDLDQALAAGRACLQRAPTYRPALHQVASLLHHLGRWEDALALLAEAAPLIEAPGVLLQRGFIESSVGRPAEAWASYRAAAAQMPCLDLPSFHHLCSVVSSLAYQAGDAGTAILVARSSGHPPLGRMADRLAQTPQGRRVELPVPFVRQRHLTCAPATLASIAQFHQLPAAEASIAEEICYDGTPAASERGWAEAQGFCTREFTVTWDSIVGLIDRGWPFTLTTQAVAAAHLQAVIGYDARRRSILVRDPAVPHLVEHDADELLKAQAWNGPRGMLLAPRAAEGQLPDLADQTLYDQAYAIELALRRHDRVAAKQLLDELHARVPDHHVTAGATAALANYDATPLRLLGTLEARLQRHPEATSLQLSLLSCLRGLQRSSERRARLEALVRTADSDPILGRLLAEDLMSNAEDAERTEQLLRRSIRARPGEATAYYSLGWLVSEHRRPEEARTLFRLAACLDDAHHSAAFLYFSTCRQLRRVDEALEFLRSRVRRRGHRFTEPALTLHDCLDTLGRTAEGLEVLEQALAARPSDGELQVQAARLFARCGRAERARALLDAARPAVKEVSWLRAAAYTEVLHGDLASARERQRRVLAIEPLSADALAEVLRLTAALDDRGAAQREAAAAAAAFPNHTGFARLLVHWTDDEGEPGLAAVRHHIEADPQDAWGHRELALRLARRHAFDEALSALERARRLDPESASYHGALGFICKWRGKIEEARTSFRAALQRDIEYLSGMSELIELGRTGEERRRELAFIRHELRRQVILGNPLDLYRNLARTDDPPEELLAFLQEARAARPDLPGAWAPAISQLVELKRLDEALGLASEAAALFSLRPEPRLQLALVLRSRGEQERERAVLQEAIALAPEDSEATKRLAESFERTGAFGAARDLLARAVARNPWDVALHGMLAANLWELGERQAALDRMEQALQIEPGYLWGWGRLTAWSAYAAARERGLAFARRLCQSRPASAFAHVGLAGLLDDGSEFGEKVGALRRAIEHQPTLVQPYEELARLLADVGRYDEARAACAPPALGQQPPTVLRGRAAVVEWQAGQRDGAVSLMEALVADVPDYLFGWTMLARWRAERDDPAGAGAALRRAYLVAPDRTDIGETLFQHQLEQVELDAAAETLAQLRRELPEAAIRLLALRLALARNEPDEALRIIEAIAAVSPADRGLLDQAGELMVASGRDLSLDRWLDRARSRGPVTAGVAYLWGSRADCSLVSRWRQLARWRREEQEVGVMGTLGYVERLGIRGSVGELRWFVRLSREALRADTRLWGAVGYALLSRNLMRPARAWLADWRQRRGVEPWMLQNLVVALRDGGQDEEARDASRAALDLPWDVAVLSHRRWLALEAALAEPFEEASRLVANAPEPGQATDAYVLAMARAALAARSDQVPAELRAGLVLSCIDEAVSADPQVARRPFARRLRRRIESLARRRGLRI